MSKIKILHPPAHIPQIELHSSIYNPKDTVYIVSESCTMETTQSLINKALDFKNKYDNAIRGLNYWKGKAQNE